MKWTLLFSLIGLVFSGVVQADYSSSRCEAIKNEREQIRERQRQGYSAFEGERLRKRDDYLFIELSRHCSGQRVDGTSSQARTFSYNQRQRELALQAQKEWEILSQKFPDMSANNALYEGSKGDAWLSFLVIPAKCRVKNISYADFVWCSEDKKQQKTNFETFWAVNSGALDFPPIPVNPLNVVASGPQVGHGKVLLQTPTVSEPSPWYGWLNLPPKQSLALVWRSVVEFALLYGWLILLCLVIVVVALLLKARRSKLARNNVVPFQPKPADTSAMPVGMNDHQVAQQVGHQATVQLSGISPTAQVDTQIAMNCPFCLEKVVEQVDAVKRTKTLTCSDAPICRFQKTEILG